MAREVLGDYLAAVGAQIRWRRARRPLLRELSDHIADQAADFQTQGLEEEAALDRAVAEMGDPETVGRDLDRLHRPQNRWGLALGVLFLLLAGPLSLPFLSFGAAYLLTNSLLAGFLLSVFRMDALLRDGPDQALPSPFPNRLDLRLPLGRGSLSIRYRRSS